MSISQQSDTKALQQISLPDNHLVQFREERLHKCARSLHLLVDCGHARTHCFLNPFEISGQDATPRAFAQKLLHRFGFLCILSSMTLLPRSLAQIKGNWTAYVVLVFALFLTVAGYIGHSKYIQNRERARFAQAAPTAIERTRSRLAVYLATLKGVSALFSTADTVSPLEIASYFERLNIHADQSSRGMDGVGVIWRVAPAERASHEARLRTQYPGYKISSKRTNETLYPIIHFDALGPSPNKALGWDVAENELRRAALIRAESAREVTMSARTLLRYADGTRGAPGFLVYVPIFGPKIKGEPPRVIGFVCGAFDAQKLFSTIFLTPGEMTTLAVFDGVTLHKDALLFDQDGQHHAERKERPLLSSTVTETIFGQQWSFHVETHSAFESSLDRKIPLVLLVVGTLGSFLLFSFVLGQIRARRAAEDLSEELRVSERALRSANLELASRMDEARRTS